MSNAPPAPPPIREWADIIDSEFYGPALSVLADTERRYDVSPGIFAQFDTNGFGQGGEGPQLCDNGSTVQRYHLRNASDWAYMIDHAGLPHQWIARETRLTKHCVEQEFVNTTTSVLWVYSYNEWGEGAGIEELDGGGQYPFHFGTQLLTTLRDTVGGGGGPNSPPPPPVQRDPDGEVDGLRPLFVWDAVPYGDLYRMQITDSSGHTDTYDRSATTFVPTSNLTSGEEYTWRVRAHSPAGWGPYSDDTAFTPQAPCDDPPDKPSLIWPKDCIGTVRPTLQWTEAAGAADYKVALWRVADDFLWTSEVDGTSYTFDMDLQPNVEYRWRVKARNGCGESWSDQIYYFTPLCVAPPPAPPVLIAPVGCTSSVLPTFSWSPAEGATSYLLTAFEVSPERPVLSIEVPGTSHTPIAPLIPGREHRWRVAARNSGPIETWSNELHFRPGCNRADLFWYEDQPPFPAYGAFLSTGDAFQFASWGYLGPGSATWIGGGDFNADGRGDLVVRRGPARTVFLSDGQQFVNSGSWGVAPLTWDPVWAAVGDFTGDGKDDVAWRGSQRGINLLESTGTRFLSNPSWYPEVDTVPTWSGVGDFNGDNRDDLVWYEDGVLPAVGVFLSTGDGFINHGDFGLFATERLTPAHFAGVGDFNGDEKDDILWYRPGHGIQVFLSDGERFIDSGDWGPLSFTWNPTWAAIGDFRATGRADVVWRTEEGSLRVLRSTGNRFLLDRDWFAPGLSIPTHALTGNYNTN